MLSFKLLYPQPNSFGIWAKCHISYYVKCWIDNNPKERFLVLLLHTRPAAHTRLTPQHMRRDSSRRWVRVSPAEPARYSLPFVTGAGQLCGQWTLHPHHAKKPEQWLRGRYMPRNKSNWTLLLFVLCTIHHVYLFTLCQVSQWNQF